MDSLKILEMMRRTGMDLSDMLEPEEDYEKILRKIMKAKGIPAFEILRNSPRIPSHS